MKKEVALFPSNFLQRFSNCRLFLPLALALLCGIAAGPVMAVALQLFALDPAAPLFFSGIPSPNAGFGACFSTLLLNLLSCLIVLFLLGVTAFGAVGIPVFLLVRGAAVGLGALWFLLYGGGMGCSALCYLPSAAGSSLLLLLFSSRALSFSNGLALAGFAKRQENLDFSFYFKDFLVFACFSVVVALTGALLAKTYGAFL